MRGRRGTPKEYIDPYASVMLVATVLEQMEAAPRPGHRSASTPALPPPAVEDMEAEKEEAPREPCPRCHVIHVDMAKAIEVRDPDDELVACGFAHLERTSKSTAYLGLHAADGSYTKVWLWVTKKGRLRMRVDEIVS